MKCNRCILEYLVDLPLTLENMLAAVEGANTAVTVAKGNAFCGRHFLFHAFENIIPSKP